MIGLNNHGEQFNTNKMLQIQKMQEKIKEEKTDRKKWLSWTEQSQREDEYQKRYYKYKKCKKK